MTLLLHIFYYFRTLPIPLVKAHLKQFQKKIIKFVWEGRGCRLSKSVLFHSREEGGLGLPDLLRYFQVAQLAHISVVYSRWELPHWIHIERQAVPLHNLDYLLLCQKKLRPSIFSPTLCHSFALWDNLRDSEQLTSPITPLKHLLQNPAFPPGLNTKAFRW